MGKLKSIQIQFNENKNVYYPGEQLKGFVIVESKGEITINALRVFMRGVTKVQWSETKYGGYRVGNYSEQYGSEIEHFCYRQVLIDGKGNISRIFL